MGVKAKLPQNMYKFLLLAFAFSQVSGDWTGHGTLACYGHFSTDVATPPGSGNVEAGTLNCRPAEWEYPDVDLGPEAMFFTGASFDLRSGLGTTITLTFLMLTALGTSGTRLMTWGLATALLTRITRRAIADVAMPTVSGILFAMDVDMK